MSRLKEFIPTPRLARASREVHDQASKLAGLGIDPASQQIGIEAFISGIMPQYEQCGEMRLSRSAEEIIRHAQKLDGLTDKEIDKISQAAKADSDRGRRKLGLFGRGKQTFSILESGLEEQEFDAQLPFHRQIDKAFRAIKSPTRESEKPLITPNEEFARQQREQVVIGAELIANGVSNDQVEFTLRRLREERITKQEPTQPSLRITVFDASNKNYL